MKNKVILSISILLLIISITIKSAKSYDIIYNIFFLAFIFDYRNYETTIHKLNTNFFLFWYYLCTTQT